MKKLIIAIALVAVLFFIIKEKDMTLRQSFLKAVYPIFIAKQTLFGAKKVVLENKAKARPIQSFYDLKATTSQGEEISFERFRGKKVFLVNTASDCGYTAQYEELQQLYSEQKENLVILAFPANDFKEQEKGNDKEIEEFCKVNFGVTFPIMQKTTVRKGYNQNKVFEWLSNKQMNGWNNKAPEWNFSKYLVDEEGVLTNYFPPVFSPLSSEVKKNL